MSLEPLASRSSPMPTGMRTNAEFGGIPDLLAPWMENRCRNPGLLARGNMQSEGAGPWFGLMPADPLVLAHGRGHERLGRLRLGRPRQAAPYRPGLSRAMRYGAGGPEAAGAGVGGGVGVATGSCVLIIEPGAGQTRDRTRVPCPHPGIGLCCRYDLGSAGVV